MNIIWLYDRPLVSEAGGTERITYLIAKGLSLEGHNCLGMLVIPNGSKDISYNTKKISNLYEFLKTNHIDIVINQIAYDRWLLETFLKDGGEKWEKDGGRIISCLHFDPQNPSDLYLMKCKRNKDLKDIIKIIAIIIFHVHYKHRQQENEGIIYNYIYDNSDWFVVLSERHIPYLKKVMRRTDYSKVVAINNPLTFDDISSPAILSEKRKIAIVCARMSEYHKRISIILKAWNIVKKQPESNEWQLVIIGDGPDLQAYKNYVASKHIPDVKFEGQQSPEAYYRIASILLLTSSAEGWGLTITEGLQRGVVPVVMDSCPVFKDIIDDGINGILTPNNRIISYAKDILKLIKNPEILKEMQHNALDSARRYLTTNIIKKWEMIINS